AAGTTPRPQPERRPPARSPARRPATQPAPHQPAPTPPPAPPPRSAAPPATGPPPPPPQVLGQVRIRIRNGCGLAGRHGRITAPRRRIADRGNQRLQIQLPRPRQPIHWQPGTGVGWLRRLVLVVGSGHGHLLAATGNPVYRLL